MLPRTFFRCLLLTTLLLPSAHASAQEPLPDEAGNALAADAPDAQSPAMPPAEGVIDPAGGGIDPADLESFLDGVFKAMMATHHVAGATVSVVHRGEMIFAKGYGYADVEAGRQVEADKTLFRPGSISKTFTWTAAMQLVEQGKLDLDTDVNVYLDDVVIPDTFPEAITMAHLMTHRPGFEDTSLGHLFADDPDEVQTLKDYLLSHQPARVRPPGTLPAYSNYGTALAGHIVAQISGMPFEDYVEQNILRPLGMDNSTFREPWGDHLPDPMPAWLAANSSVGYEWKNGQFKSHGFEFISPVGPAGALSTTAIDMAKFMLAHLNDGSLDGARILRPETARRMHTLLWSPDPAMSGNAYGFLQYNEAGHVGFGHSGGTLFFLSDMVMLPELDFGLFFSTNTSSGGKLIADVPRLVVERYFGDVTDRAPEPPADFAERAAKIAGTYVSTRRSYELVEKFIMLPMSVVTFAPTEDNYLLMGSGEQASRWVEIEPYTFRQVDGPNVMTFDVDEAGNVTGVPMYMPVAQFEKVSALGNPNLLLGIIGFALFVFACALVGAWLRRGRGLPQSSGEAWAGRITLLMALLWVAWGVLAVAALMPLAGDIPSAMFGFPSATFVNSLTIAIAATVLTVLAVLLLWPVWSSGQWRVWRKLRHTAVVFLGVAVVLILNDMNVIGYHYF